MARAVVLLLVMALPGCVSSLGYLPPAPSTVAAPVTLIPTYTEAKVWAYDVHLALISRTVANRSALYTGSTLAIAGSAALAGLVAMGSASPALAVIPLATGALGAAAMVYNNASKADLYQRAANLTMLAILASDARVSAGVPPGPGESTCLRQDVYAVLHRVGRHLTALDPQQMPALLANVKAGAVALDAPEVKAATGDMSDLDAFTSTCASVLPTPPASAPRAPVAPARVQPEPLWAHPSRWPPTLRAVLHELAPD